MTFLNIFKHYGPTWPYKITVFTSFFLKIRANFMQNGFFWENVEPRWSAEFSFRFQSFKDWDWNIWGENKMMFCQNSHFESNFILMPSPHSRWSSWNISYQSLFQLKIRRCSHFITPKFWCFPKHLDVSNIMLPKHAEFLA